MGENRLDRCDERLYPWGTCPNKARYEHENKWFCKIHHLPTRAAKEKARSAVRNKKINARLARWDHQGKIQQAQQKVLALAAKFHTTLDSGTPALWMMSEGPDELFEAVGRLKSLGWEPEEVD